MPDVKTKLMLRMRSRKCLPFRSTWFHFWFS